MIVDHRQSLVDDRCSLIVDHRQSLIDYYWWLQTQNVSSVFDHDLWTESFNRPCIGYESVSNPVVQSTGSALPELNVRRHESESAPGRGLGNTPLLKL